MDNKQMRVLFADEKEGKNMAMEEETRARLFFVCTARSAA